MKQNRGDRLILLHVFVFVKDLNIVWNPSKDLKKTTYFRLDKSLPIQSYTQRGLLLRKLVDPFFRIRNVFLLSEQDSILSVLCRPFVQMETRGVNPLHICFLIDLPFSPFRIQNNQLP